MAAASLQYRQEDLKSSSLVLVLDARIRGRVGAAPMRLASLTVIASYLLRCHQRGSTQSQHAPNTSSTANVHSIRTCVQSAFHPGTYAADLGQALFQIQSSTSRRI